MTQAPLRPEVVALPGLRSETEALLARLTDEQPKPAAETDLTEADPYLALLQDREELPDPRLAGECDPRTRPEDIILDLPHRALAGRVYRPPIDGQRPMLLWLHGGGFVGGDLRDIEYAASGIAVAGSVVVVSLNYRLAPEHPYPAALHDTIDSLDWLRQYASELGGDGRLAVGGQSAGASLAAGVCLVAREEGLPSPDRQVLCYPALDIGQTTESFRLFDGVLLSIAPGGWIERQYYPPGPLPTPAVPLRAQSLSGLPPALVVAAGRDPLRDDARGYAIRLAESRVATRLVEYRDTMHAFLNFPAVLTAGRHAVSLIGEDLKRHY